MEGARLADRVVLAACLLGVGLIAWLLGVRESDRRSDCRTLLDTLRPGLAEISRREQDPAYAAASPEALKAVSTAYADLAQSLQNASLSDAGKPAADAYARALRDVVRGYDELGVALTARDEGRLKNATSTLFDAGGRERRATNVFLGLCGKR